MPLLLIQLLWNSAKLQLFIFLSRNKLETTQMQIMHLLFYFLYSDGKFLYLYYLLIEILRYVLSCAISCHFTREKEREMREREKRGR